MDLFFSSFLKDKAKDLQKIASQTQGDLRVDDLKNEAWLAAEYHAAKRGCAIDWSDPNDQDLILGTLTVQHVWRKNAERKLTISADKEREDHEGEGWSLMDQLYADEATDPLVLLERREEEENKRVQTAEEQQKAEDEILESYSQSVAYTIALWNFDNIFIRLAVYLVVAPGTLQNRIAQAAESLKLQSSLFDRIERISDSFTPQRGQAYEVRHEQHLSGQQLGWDFAPASHTYF
jgi:hypothetical protein